jgi:hypothetical protein
MTNPYEAEFGILPIEEMRRMLRPYRRPKILGPKYPNEITLNDITKLTKIHRTQVRAILDNKPPHPSCKCTFGKTLRRRLSRFLLRAACGMIEKKDGKFIYHNEPTKPMPVVRRIALGVDGPKMLPGKQAEVPRSMPKFVDLFRVAPTINLPKGLR